MDVGKLGERKLSELTEKERQLFGLISGGKKNNLILMILREKIRVKRSYVWG